MNDYRAIEVPMPIITPRLILRPLEVRDAPFILEAQQESWDELSKWKIWTFAPLDQMTVAINEEFCCLKQEKFAVREDITLAVYHKETGKFIGGCGLHKCNWQDRSFSLGFWVRSSETGNGYASEIGNSLIYYAFETLSAKAITSFHETGNSASQRVLEKLGFRKATDLGKDFQSYTYNKSSHPN